MRIQIESRWTGAIIFECEADSLKLAVELAVSKKVSLRGSYLRGSDLRGSDLRDSDLRGSDLRDSDLRGSDLRGSYLRDSDLRGSDLRDSDLRGSDLSGSDLSGSDLSGSDLSGSDLSGSDLSGSDLSGSDLSPIRQDFFDVLFAAPAEVAGLRKALEEGRVDGSTYRGECACLVGTIANVRGVSHNDLGDLRPSATRPAERFFLGINKGDTPKKSQFVKLAVGWIDEWKERVETAAKAISK